MNDYPYVRAWGRLIAENDEWVAHQVALAGREHAPQDACVAPYTRILTWDLRYVRAEAIRSGDALLGFDETAGPARAAQDRHWKMSIVESAGRVVKPSYRLTLDDGVTVTCSHDHQWLTESLSAKTSSRRWVRTEDLDGEGHWTRGRKPGRPSGDRVILQPLRVWQDNTSREGGYLAGAFDGEGCLGYQSADPKVRGTFRISLAQKDNELLKTVRGALDALSFDYAVSAPRSNDVLTLFLKGGFAEYLRFLGSIRPHRLLTRMRPELGRFDVLTRRAVVGREFLGDVELVSIQTSTRTFIAEGLASHNCYRNASGRWVRSSELSTSTREELERLAGGGP